MEVLVKDGVVHSLQRGDTVVVTLGGPVSAQGRMLMQRQLRALFPAQKVVILDPGMTFQVYSEQAPVVAAMTPEPEPKQEPQARPRRS